MTIKTAGVYVLSLEDADALQRLASDPAVAATTRIPHPYPENAAREFVSHQLKERAEGTAYVFAIKDRQQLVGVCGLHGIEGDQAKELGFWIGRPFWGKGYATFGVRMVLQFAFQNLKLQRIHSYAFESNGASRRVLERNGFRLLRVEPPNDPSLKRPDQLLAAYEITRKLWLDFINVPALSVLDARLKTILQAEIAAGNEIAETGGGWPDRDSVFVRLRQTFYTRPSALADGVEYKELNDPHWWQAEFSTRSPRHILAC
jgi:[ribosomal protein S5]-alanine N-acetyltransferase